MARHHHHHSRRVILQHSATSKISDSKKKKKYQHLLRSAIARAKKTEQILGEIVENSIQTPHKEDLEKVKLVLIDDVRREEHRVLSNVEKEATKAEEAILKVQPHEVRINECLEKIAKFAKANRETDLTRHRGPLPYQDEIESLVTELSQYGIHAPTKWKGRLAQYDSPMRMLTRYENLWEITRREGIASAIRREAYQYAVYRVNNFFSYLGKKIAATFNAIKMNFIAFKNWIQAKLGSGEFQAMTQSTHLASVHKSVTQSVKRLQKRYPSVNVRKALNEIEAKIKTAKFKEPQEFYRQAAINSLKRIKASDWKDNDTELNLPQVAALMWVAAKDQPAYDAVFGKSTTSDRDIDDRMTTFVEYLWRAEREYNLNQKSVDDMKPASQACFPGTFNKIVESLDKLHPDVKIIRSKEAANALAIEEVKKFYHQHRDQKALYDAHTTAEPSEEQKNMIKAMKKYVKNRLEEEIGETLTADDIQGILDNIEYVDLPEPDNGPSAIVEHQQQQKSAEKLRDPEVEAAMEWAATADIDEYPNIQNKINSIKSIDAWLSAIESKDELNPMQKNMIKLQTKYAGNIDDKTALMAHLEQAKTTRTLFAMEAKRGKIVAGSRRIFCAT